MEVLLESILNRKNLVLAYHQVVGNKGAPGVDGITVDELGDYLKSNWSSINEEIRRGKYKPSAVRRVSIPKPNGGERHLGIPTVLDRVIQHSISQELDNLYDEGFSKYSYGFRKGRSAHQALEKSLDYIKSGHEYMVSIDLEKFFDRVNHDKLMSKLSKKIKDKEVLRLIRRYLQSGILDNGVVRTNREGTPQGGNLSPILSNIVLDELDKELESRGLRFVRYADDISIFVKSPRAGERVLLSVSNWIEQQLQLRVNVGKSGVEHCSKSGLLGYGFFYKAKEGYEFRVLARSYKRFQVKLKRLTKRSWSVSLDYRLDKLRQTMQGWLNYYGLAHCKHRIIKLEKWLRRRIRMCIWKTWKLVRTKKRSLIKLGVSKEEAHQWANTRKGYWIISGSPILETTITNRLLEKRGYRSMVSYYLYRHSNLMNRRDTRPVCPVV